MKHLPIPAAMQQQRTGLYDSAAVSYLFIYFFKFLLFLIYLFIYFLIY